MKKITTLVLCLMTLISAASCTVLRDSEITEDSEFSSTSSEIGVYVLSASEKVFRDEEYIGSGKKYVSINAVKNEVESGSFVIRCDSSDMENVSAHVTDLTDGRGNTVSASVFREYYVLIDHLDDVEPYYAPDALVPLFDGEDGNNSVTVERGRNQAFYISAKTTADTPAGTYRGEATVDTSLGTVTVPVVLTVNDITLPVAANMKTNLQTWGNGGGSGAVNVYAPYGVDGAEMLHEFVLERRLNVPRLPHMSGTSIDAFEQTVLRYGLDERVQVILFPCFSENIASGIIGDAALAKQKEWYARMDALGKANGCPDLVSKLYIVPVHFDEIDSVHSPDRFAAAVKYCETISAAIPESKVAIPLSSDESALYGKLSVWIVNQRFTEENIEKIRNAGAKEVWTYGTEGFLIGLHENVSGKTLFWAEHRYGLEGYLAWAIDNYQIHDVVENKVVEEIRDFWNNPYNFTDEADYMKYGGDGVLVYCGTEDDGIVGRNMICSSLRYEQLADGIEDYDLLCIRREQIEKRLSALGVTDLDASDFMAQYYDAFSNNLEDAGGTSYPEAEKYDVMRACLINDILADDPVLISVRTDTDPSAAALAQQRTVTVVGAQTVSADGFSLENRGDRFVGTAEILLGFENIRITADGREFSVPVFSRMLTEVCVISDYAHDQTTDLGNSNNMSFSSEGLVLDFSQTEGVNISSSIWTNVVTRWKGYTYLAVKVTNTGDKDIPSVTLTAASNMGGASSDFGSVAVGESKILSMELDPALTKNIMRRVKLSVPDTGGELTVEYIRVFNIK